MLMWLMPTLRSVLSKPCVTPISNGTANTGLSGTTGSMQHYVLNVPTISMEVECTTSGNNGDADLYMHVGAEVSPTSNDCSSSNELCTIITSLSATKVYAAVDAYVAYANLMLTCVTIKATKGPTTQPTLSPMSESSVTPMTNDTANAGLSGITAAIQN
jgi:hypothetical protein